MLFYELGKVFFLTKGLTSSFTITAEATLVQLLASAATINPAPRVRVKSVDGANVGGGIGGAGRVFNAVVDFKATSFNGCGKLMV